MGGARVEMRSPGPPRRRAWKSRGPPPATGQPLESCSSTTRGCPTEVRRPPLAPAGRTGGPRSGRRGTGQPHRLAAIGSPRHWRQPPALRRGRDEVDRPGRRRLAGPAEWTGALWVRGLLILDRTAASDGRSGLIGRALCSCKSLQFFKMKMISKGALIFASKIQSRISCMCTLNKLIK